MKKQNKKETKQFLEHLKKVGFKNGNIPWNKGLTSKYGEYENKVMGGRVIF